MHKATIDVHACNVRSLKSLHYADGLSPWKCGKCSKHIQRPSHENSKTI